MFVGFFTWWYGDGLNGRIKAIAERLARVGDFFSVGLLAQTLFAPFRQLSTGRVNGPLGVQLQAFFDNLISRIIGAFVRLAMMIAALITSVSVFTFGVLVIAGWLLLPLLPLGGLVLVFVRSGS